MWPKLGFIPLAERPGRSVTGEPLTHWWHDFGHATLFTLAEQWEKRPSAALDSSVFFDLASAEPSPEAQAMRADWLDEHVRLAITDEVLVEISQDRDRIRRNQHQIAARRFTTLTPNADAWQPILGALRAAHPGSPRKDEEDLRQLARALAAEASWLVTSDRSLKSRYASTADQIGGLRVVMPDEFIREVDALANEDWYRPIDLAGTNVESREVVGGELKLVATTFVNHASGETIRELRSTLRVEILQATKAHVRVVKVDGEDRGLACFLETGDTLRVPILRVTGGKGEGVIGRHLLAYLRSLAVESGLSSVVVHDLHLPQHVQRQFLPEGFLGVDDRYFAYPLRGAGTVAGLVRRLDHLGVESRNLTTIPSNDLALLPEQAAELESVFHPYRLIGAPLQTYTVPIRHHWASELFDVGLAEDKLFPRQWDLGLRRELVYYRNPKNSGGIAEPARIIWYVSGPGAGGQRLRAVSLLNEVTVDSAEHLFNRFSRLGVYSLSDVEDSADSNGRVMAMRFSHTELFQRPVLLDEYRAITSRHSQSASPVLRSPQRINQDVFGAIYELATGKT